MKPVASGIYIKKDGIFIVIARFVIVTSAGARISYGIRMQTDAGHVDSLEPFSSPSAYSNCYNYIRMGKYIKGMYLRPIASGSGTCSGCTLIVLSLKAG